MSNSSPLPNSPRSSTSTSTWDRVASVIVAGAVVLAGLAVGPAANAAPIEAVSGTVLGQTTTLNPVSGVGAVLGYFRTEVDCRVNRDGLNMPLPEGTSTLVLGEDVGYIWSWSWPWPAAPDAVIGFVRYYKNHADGGSSCYAVTRDDFPSGVTATITGPVKVGAEIAASAGPVLPVDADPSTRTPASKISYAWTIGTEVVGTEKKFTPLATQAGSELKLTVTAKNFRYNDSVHSVDLGTIEGGSLDVEAHYTGTPKVGVQLSATKPTDLPAGAEVAYDWKVAGSSTATTQTFTPTPQDAGKSVTLTVKATARSFDDVSDTTTGATIANGTMMLVADYTGNLQVGQKLTATKPTGLPAGADVTYDWRVSGTTAGNGPTFVPLGKHGGMNLALTVSATSDGYDDATDTTLGNPVALGRLNVEADYTGTPAVGQELTGKTQGGLPEDAVVTYTWLVAGTKTETGQTFTPTTAQANLKVSLLVTATSLGYEDAQDQTYDVTIAKASMTFTAAYQGTAKVDVQLTADKPTGLPDGAEVTYDWQVAGASRGTEQMFTPSPIDEGKTLTLTVTAKASGYNDASDTTADTTVAAGTIVVAAAFTGDPTPGQQLTATKPTNLPDGAVVSYLWTVADATPVSGQTFTPAPGDAEKSLTLTVKITATGYGDASDSTEPVTIRSSTIKVVAAYTPAPKVGVELSAMAQTGLPTGAEVTYAWSVAGGSSGTGSTFVPAPGDAGKNLSLTVSAKADNYVASSDTTRAVAVAKGSVATSAALTVTDPMAGQFIRASVPGLPNGARVDYLWGTAKKKSDCRPQFAAQVWFPVTSLVEGRYICVTARVTASGYLNGTATATTTTPARASTLTLSDSTPGRGQEFVVSVNRLLPRQAYVLWVDGSKLTGTVDVDGRIDRTISFPTSAKAGRHSVLVQTFYANADGSQGPISYNGVRYPTVHR
ncbi:MAG: putative surface-anchored protein [Marmoricola sp.]|nr:putative surface-anchored protein [Marmoricola sp.]